MLMLPPSTAQRNSWPPDYISVWAWRQQKVLEFRSHPERVAWAKAYYATHPVEFINHWLDTFDPRLAGRKGRTAKMPFVLFQKQAEMIEYLVACIEGEENGLVEKARDMGATWVCCALSVWLWLFWEGASIGWGSRKEQLVDKLGDPDSIFEKIRILLKCLPVEFLPAGFSTHDHMPFMRIVNPENGSTITGEAGDNIGRGGRKLIYFKDESAHYERPEKIEAALADNTRVQIDISSVNGLGNVFHRRREAGVEWTSGAAIPGKTNVFVMDWRDHPEKDDAWYQARKAKAKADGLLHVFAQEVERNYAAAVDGVIIPAEWVTSAIDAQRKLKLPPPTGRRVNGLDVADEGGDLNGHASRKSYLLDYVQDWGEGDTGATTRKAVEYVRTLGEPVEMQYDCIGIGAGVKAESNRLASVKELPYGLTFVPWSAADAVQFPKKHLLRDENGFEDKKSPTNEDFYANLKAQAWWELRLRFERTHNAVTQGFVYAPEDLISLPSWLPKLRQLQKELSQAVAKTTTNSRKLYVDKKPPGTRSPNLADSVVMAFFPVDSKNFNLSGMAS